jgi:ABC-type nitrate/sulfonate/bicarbonate transport system substrate-binding protein
MAVRGYKTKIGALAVAGAMVLAACGGGDDDAEGALRVITSAEYDLSMIGAEAAHELGLFEESGLDVKLMVSQDAAQALASGDADIAIASPNRFIGAIEKGLPAKIVGPTIDIWGQYIIVRSDLNLKSVDDWEGGKIGVSNFGSAGHYSGVKLAQTLGWSESDYEIVPVGDLNGLMAALRSGSIDAFMWSAHASFTLEHEGAAHILGNVGETIGPNPLDVITATDKALEERPEDIKQFCSDYYAAQKMFKEDEQLAADTFKKWGKDSKVMPDILDSGLPVLSTTSEITPEMIANMADATTFTIDGSKVTADAVAKMYVDCSSL